MTNHNAFQSLLLLTVLAALVPVLVRQLRRFVPLPIVVGEIIAGIAVGQSALNLVQESPVLDFLAEFGFIFLMFLSGLEVNLNGFTEAPAGGSTPRPVWQRPGWLAAFNFILTLMLGLITGIALWRWNLTQNPILMGLILSTTSMGIVVPVLKERELTRKPYGQLILLSALFSDFFTLLLLGLVISIIRKGLSVDVMFFAVLLVAFVGAAKFGNWAQRHTLTQRVLDELSHATAQIRVRGAFALIVLWVVMAGSLGVEVILGAFLAGAIVGQSRSSRQIFEEKLDAMGYGFFIPIFFIMVGARFDLASLVSSPSALWLVALLIGAAYLVKLLPALCFRSLFSWRETFAAGALLSSRLSLIIAASAIALSLGMITSATNSAIVLLAMVTCTASPILFNRLLPVSSEGKRFGVIVLGTDFLAELLGKRLLQDGEPVTFIGRDLMRLEKLREAGCVIVSGPPDDEQVLHQAGAESARALVAVSSDPAVVARACGHARDVFRIPSIVARADEPEQVRTLQAMGVQVVQPAMAMALGFEGALHYPAAFSTLIDKSDQFDFADAPLHNSSLLDRPIRQIHLPGKALVLGIRRRAEVIVPHGDTILRQGDVLMLCGEPEAMDEARKWIGGE